MGTYTVQPLSISEYEKIGRLVESNSPLTSWYVEFLFIQVNQSGDLIPRGGSGAALLDFDVVFGPSPFSFLNQEAEAFIQIGGFSESLSPKGTNGIVTVHFSIPTTFDTPTSYRLSIVDSGHIESALSIPSAGLSIQNLEVTAIPEPGFAVLVGVLLLGGAAVRSRRAEEP
jgi:hypothetical protein